MGGCDWAGTPTGTGVGASAPPMKPRREHAGARDSNGLPDSLTTDGCLRAART
jgi:hypothetical protein